MEYVLGKPAWVFLSPGRSINKPTLSDLKSRCCDIPRKYDCLNKCWKQGGFKCVDSGKKKQTSNAPPARKTFWLSESGKTTLRMRIIQISPAVHGWVWLSQNQGFSLGVMTVSEGKKSQNNHVLQAVKRKWQHYQNKNTQAALFFHLFYPSNSLCKTPQPQKSIFSSTCFLHNCFQAFHTWLSRSN